MRKILVLLTLALATQAFGYNGINRLQLIEDRYKLQEKLRENKIESNQVHFRNDRYSIFKEFTDGKVFPNMDRVEDDYLVLPLHTMMDKKDVIRICSIIKSGW